MLDQVNALAICPTRDTQAADRMDAPNMSMERPPSVVIGRARPESSLIAGRYRLGCLLGRGGVATVYAARDLVLARPVAIKLLARHHIRDEQTLARFDCEGRITAGLRHPNVVDVLDVGVTGSDLPYLVMELLEGENLRHTIEREGHLPWSRVRTLMLDICAGLEAVHAAGIVHRDLKPANCFRIDAAGRESVRLVDFGIARRIGAGAGPRVTLDNHVVGTPEYMSPEQARGVEVDVRSDIYAVGIILGELLTGKLPFDAETPSAMLAAQVYIPPKTLAERAPEGVEFPPELESIHARALSKDPSLRYEDAASLATALRRVDAQSSKLSFLSNFDTSRTTQVSPIPRVRPTYLLTVCVAFVLGVLAMLTML